MNLALGLFVLWILINYINGLYDLASTYEGKGYKRISEAGLSALIVSVVLLYLLPQTRLTPKTILVLGISFGYLISTCWRLGFNRLIGNKKLSTRILFVGYSEDTQELMDIIERHPEKGYEVVAICDPENGTQAHKLKTRAAVYRSLKALRPAISTHKIQLIVAAPNLRDTEETLRELYELLFWPVSIIDYSKLYENVTGRISPVIFSENWFLANLTNHENHIYNKSRRVADYLVSFIIGLLMIVLFPLIAMLIKLNSKGPVFFKQKRVGQFGRIFTMYKFRTMYALAPDGSAEESGAQFAKKGDKRITAIGKILRKMRIDELPQCINLFRGDLSLIGPRPERPEIVEKLEAKMPYYPLRHIVKPGITGWAAIHQHYTDTMETSLQKLQYDLFYIKNRSFLLDLIILLRTVNVVIRMMGQ